VGKGTTIGRQSVRDQQDHEKAMGYLKGMLVMTVQIKLRLWKATPCNRERKPVELRKRAGCRL